MACDKFRQKWGKDTDLDVLYVGCEIPAGDKVIEPGMTLREVIEILSVAGGETPYIGDNGNWWIGDLDTGVKAEGEDGDTPYIGDNGNWWIRDIDTGVPAQGEASELAPESDTDIFE